MNSLSEAGFHETCHIYITHIFLKNNCNIFNIINMWIAVSETSLWRQNVGEIVRDFESSIALLLSSTTAK
jgi:uncharacterized membrane protein